jgi:hypothetical protein
MSGLLSGEKADQFRAAITPSGIKTTAVVQAGTELEITNDSGNPIPTREQYAPVFEDNTLGKAVVEQRYSYSRKTADGQVKASAGFIHAISIAPLTATPTAGLLSIYDSLTESGTVIYSEWIFATDVGRTIILDVECLTGIYVGFDATLANVGVTLAYR